MKYEFTGQVKVVGGITFRQIRALVAIASIGVAAGEVGGWVEKDGNLSQNGNAWVSGNARVSGNAWVNGDARVYGNARVSGDARVYGNAWILKPTQVLVGFFQARTGVYSLTLYSAKDTTEPRFTWGCRDGDSLSEYLSDPTYEGLRDAPLAFLQAWKLSNKGE